MVPKEVTQAAAELEPLPPYIPDLTQFEGFCQSSGGCYHPRRAGRRRMCTCGYRPPSSWWVLKTSWAGSDRADYAGIPALSMTPGHRQHGAPCFPGDSPSLGAGTGPPSSKVRENHYEPPNREAQLTSQSRP